MPVEWVAGLLTTAFVVTWGAIGYLYMLRERDREAMTVELAEAKNALNARLVEIQTALAAHREDSWVQREAITKTLGKMVTTDELEKQTSQLLHALRDIRPVQQRVPR